MENYISYPQLYLSFPICIRKVMLDDHFHKARQWLARRDCSVISCQTVFDSARLARKRSQPMALVLEYHIPRSNSGIRCVEFETVYTTLLLMIGYINPIYVLLIALVAASQRQRRIAAPPQQPSNYCHLAATIYIYKYRTAAMLRYIFMLSTHF